MGEEFVRTHVLLPLSLVREVDRRAGHRRRSRYVAEALAEKLRHDRLLENFDRVVGSLAADYTPDWEKES